MPKKSKPHKGRIENWELVRVDRPLDGLTFYATGRFVDHPEYAGRSGHTSMITKAVFKDGGVEIETMNSRYTIKQGGLNAQGFTLQYPCLHSRCTAHSRRREKRPASKAGQVRQAL